MAVLKEKTSQLPFKEYSWHDAGISIDTEATVLPKQLRTVSINPQKNKNKKRNIRIYIYIEENRHTSKRQTYKPINTLPDHPVQASSPSNAM